MSVSPANAARTDPLDPTPVEDSTRDVAQSSRRRVDDMQTQMAAFTFGGLGISTPTPSTGRTRDAGDHVASAARAADDERSDIGQIRSDFRFGTCPPTSANDANSTSHGASSSGTSSSTAPRLPPVAITNPAAAGRHSPAQSYAHAYTVPAVPHAGSALTATPTIEYGAFEYPSIPDTDTDIDAVNPTTDYGSLSGPPSPTRPYRPLRSSRGSLESPISPLGASVAYPLGESHRRNSIIARPYGSFGGTGGRASASASASAHHTPTGSMSVSGAISSYAAMGQTPPQAKRSITCSDIATVPASGRRPSILHSATMAVGEDVAALPMAQVPQPAGDVASSPRISSDATGSGEREAGAINGASQGADVSANAAPARPELLHTTSSSSSTATITPTSFQAQLQAQTRRRTSLMFQPKTLPSPIPPSLLARRGSLPFSSLSPALRDGASGQSKQRAEMLRASFSGLQTYGGVRDVTSHRLYHRKESLVVGPAAQQSSMGGEGNAALRGTAVKGARGDKGHGGAREGGREALHVGPGLVAVPDIHAGETPADDSGGPDSEIAGGADTTSTPDRQAARLRRSSVPHSLRSTVHSPAQHISNPRAPAYPRVDAYHSRDNDREARRAVRDRYMSYDRASRPAFSRGLSSSDESDELGLEHDAHVQPAECEVFTTAHVNRRVDDCEREEQREGEGEGEGEAGGETDEVESLPTPGLETALDLGMDTAPLAAPSSNTTGSKGPKEAVGGKWSEVKVRGTDTDDEEEHDQAVAVRERPMMEERGSDETVKGVQAAEPALM